MRILETFDDIDLAPLPKPICLTIGVFDGLHVGHRALIATVVDKARAEGGTSVVFTFREHPLRTLAPPHAPPRLITARRRRELLADLGVGVLIEIPFSREFAALTPMEFVRGVLVARCGISFLACGSNFRFGCDGEGDVDFLETLGPRNHFEVHALVELLLDDTTASSTGVRDLILHGDVERAAGALCRHYELEGHVVEGDQRGRTIGYPTANLSPIEHLTIPARGVYACWAKVWKSGEKKTSEPETLVRGAMVNIGHRPTFAGRGDRIEAHLIDFEGDLYGAELSLAFLKRLREERPFTDVEELQLQLRRDERVTRTLLEETPIPWQYAE